MTDKQLSILPVVISAPFGNYIQPAGATPTLGTFTAAARGGRVWRVIKTVRYYRRLGAWVNKIGLRNPGMAWLVNKVKAGKVDVSDKLVSIHGFTQDDWDKLLASIVEIKPMGVELNMSCPNVGEIDMHADLFKEAVETGVPVVVKLPPVRYEQMVEHAVDAGVTVFHCCNTLPVAGGGMSGQPLKHVTLNVIEQLRETYGDRLRLIGGGGIYAEQDVADYYRVGADHIALGTKLMHPKYLFSHAGVQPILEAANRS